MGLTTNIAWTDATLNFWIGCSKVSDACRFCYAEVLDEQRMSKSLGGGTKESPISHWGKGAPRYLAKEAASNMRKLQRQAVKEGRRFRVFCMSLADVFDEEVPAEWREDLFDLIAECSELDFQLLTKRPEMIRPLLEKCYLAEDASERSGAAMVRAFLHRNEAMPNVWLGVTAEDQPNANFRLRHLSALPAVVRFVSAEPLLGPVTFTHADRKSRGYINYLAGKTFATQPEMPATDGLPSGDVGMIHQVIVGGESGADALPIRPMNPNWARSIRAQCALWKTHFFFKQWGAWFPASHRKIAAVEDADVVDRWGFEGDTDAANMLRASFHASKYKLPNVLDGRKHLAIPLYTPADFPPKEEPVADPIHA